MKEEEGKASDEQKQKYFPDKKQVKDTFEDEYIQELENNGETAIIDRIITEAVLRESSSESASSLPGAYSIVPGVRTMSRRSQSNTSSNISRPADEEFSSLGDAESESDSNTLVRATLVRSNDGMQEFSDDNSSGDGLLSSPSPLPVDLSHQEDLGSLLRSPKGRCFLLLAAMLLFIGVAALVASAVQGAISDENHVQYPASTGPNTTYSPPISPTEESPPPSKAPSTQVPSLEPWSDQGQSAPKPPKDDPLLPTPTTPPPTTTEYASPTTTSPSSSPTTHQTQSPAIHYSQSPTNSGIEELIYDTLFDELPLESIEALEQEDSPQAQAVQWLLEDGFLHSNGERVLDENLSGRILQRFALATLYFSTNGGQWLQNPGWLSSDHECDWHSSIDDPGFSPCHGDDLVHLNLSRNGLAGSIPPEINLLKSLGKYSFLTRGFLDRRYQPNFFIQTQKLLTCSVTR
jgi:hypothetical protein